jgi:PAS domain S-box-containing protein
MKPTTRRLTASPEQAPAPPDLQVLIFDSIHEGVFTVDSSFHITSFNAAAERITGVPRADALGRKCYEIFRTSVCQSDCALRRTLRTGQPLRQLRIDILDAQMRTVPIEVSTAALREGDKWIGGVEIFRDISEVEALRQQISEKHQYGNMVGSSPVMQEIFRMLPDIAASDAPVLIEGPSGTGKELVANAVHQLSGRRDRAFVQVNCAALPDTLLESELFGFEKGAFTDARKDKPGRFVLANGGTLFLDEIGDVSHAFQAKLLRVLQQGEIQPLGSTRSIRVDVRVVAATNKDLRALVAAGRFREDLYYRLHVVPISIPPLRERPADIPLLVDHFLRKLAGKTGKPIRQISSRAIEMICAYHFPGNVRELENGLHRAFVLCRGDQIDVEHLPPEWNNPLPAQALDNAPLAPPAPVEPEAAAPLTDRDQAASELLEVLKRQRWNRTAAARELGIARNTLWRRMKAAGLIP